MAEMVIKIVTVGPDPEYQDGDINDLCVATTRIGHNYVVTGDGS